MLSIDVVVINIELGNSTFCKLFVSKCVLFKMVMSFVPRLCETGTGKHDYTGAHHQGEIVTSLALILGNASYGANNITPQSLFLSPE